MSVRTALGATWDMLWYQKVWNPACHMLDIKRFSIQLFFTVQTDTFPSYRHDIPPVLHMKVAALFEVNIVANLLDKQSLGIPITSGHGRLVLFVWMRLQSHYR